MASLDELQSHLAANPDDWPAWLVLGDLLSEHGDVRGELIRLEHLHAEAAPDARAELQHQLVAMVKANEPAWRGPAPTGEGVTLDWRHGFIVGLELPWVDDTAAQLKAFLASPASRLLTTLAVTRVGETLEEEEFDDDGQPVERDPAEVKAALKELLELDLSRLTTLCLAFVTIGSAGAKVLAKATSLSNLRQLDLRYCQIRDAGLGALLDAPFLQNLEVLHLQSNLLKASGIRALAARDLPKLRVLDVRDNEIKSTGAKALAAASFVKRLSVLGVQRADLGPAGVKALSKAPLAPHLSALWKGMASVKQEQAHDED